MKYSREELLQELKKRGESLEEKPSSKDQLKRQGLRTARSLATGVAGVADIGYLPFNAVAAAFGKPNYFGTPSETIRNKFDQLTGGVAKPQNLTEKATDVASEFIASGGGFGKLGSKFASSAPKTAQAFNQLSPQNTRELVSSGSAGFGSGYLGGEDNSAAGQLLGGLIGGAAPFTPQILNKSLFNVNPDKVNIAKQSGLKPTIADVSDSDITKKIQQVATNIPFANKPIINNIKQSQKDLKDFINNIKQNRNLTEQESGDMALQAIRNYEESANKTTEKLKENLNRFKGDGTDTLNLTKTLDTINDQPFLKTKQIKSLKENSVAGNYNQMIKEISEQNNGKIPFNDAHYLRQSIDEKINSFGIQTTDKNQGELKRLRASLSQDMDNYFKDQGPEAYKAFKDYNKHYSEFAKQKEEVFDKLTKNKGATEVFRKIINNQNVDARFTKAVLNKMNPEERKIFSGSLINQLGMTKENEFNLSKLATQFKSLEPEAQNAVLGAFDNDTANKFKKVIEAIDLTKETAKQANFSNTANNLILTGLAGAGAFAPLKVGGALVVGTLASTAFTSPKFINWLAKAAETNISGLPVMIQELNLITKENPELQPIANQIESIAPQLERDNLIKELQKRGEDISEFIVE